MIMLDDYTTIKRRVENFRRRQAEAEGALAEVLRQMEAECGVASVKKGDKELARLTAEEASLAEEYTQAYNRFMAEWKDRLPGD